MKRISISDLKTNPEKYIAMAQDQDILITKNGKIAAKLVAAKPDKKEALNRLMALFDGVSLTDEEARNAREEHLLGQR